MSASYRFLFGPVRSRRLGRSLGVDLVPLKVCTYDCPYCQVGRTTERTLERREYVPVDQVLAEFDDWMARGGQADVVTLAGNGEPTLHSRFGEIIDAIGDRCRFRRILLSNGSLFSLSEVRRSAARAEVVKATLSSWDQNSFAAAHQPHPSLQFPVFIGGLKALRREFSGEYWLEVFAVPGVNDTPEQMGRIAAFARAVAPDRIHLNTAVRPARDGGVLPVPESRLREFAALFEPVAEVVGTVAPAPAAPVAEIRPDELAGRLMSLVQRHPGTVRDMAMSLGVDAGKVEQVLSGLVGQRLLQIETRGQDEFYVVRSGTGP